MKKSIKLTLTDRLSVLRSSATCGCASLGVMLNTDRDQLWPTSIERCDECRVFDTDIQAAAFVLEVLQALHKGSL